MPDHKTTDENSRTQASTSGLPPVEHRPARRKRVLYAGIIVYTSGKFSVNCTIRDLSDHGARITVLPDIRIPASFYLVNIHDGIAYDAKVIWNMGIHAGVIYENRYLLSGEVDRPLHFLQRMWHARRDR